VEKAVIVSGRPKVEQDWGNLWAKEIMQWSCDDTEQLGPVTGDYRRRKEQFTGLEEEMKCRTMTDRGETPSMFLKNGVLWRKGNLPNGKL